MADKASRDRRKNIEVMDIYEVQSKKCMSPVERLLFLRITCVTVAVPTRAEIQLQLSKRENLEHRAVGASAWISAGLKIDETRLVV